MAYTPSFKVLVFVTFLVAVLFQITHAQFDDGEDDYFESRPSCPNESLVHYRNCRGSLDQCSTCLGNAERTCRDELKKQGKDGGICYHCTSQVAGNCDNIKPMCFGNQECRDPNHKCIDYTCTYQSPSK